MLMRRYGARFWLVAVGLAVPMGSIGVRADLTSMEEQAIASSYGSGVHAYFAGDFDRTYEILSQAIEAGTTDPRVWYFRGLAALKLGRTDEAEADFTTGSKKESEHTGERFVARALERVQGRDRVKLERYRVQARVASLQEDRRRSNLRYLGVESAEPEVLRDRVPETVRPPLPAPPFQPSVEGQSEEPIRVDEAPATSPAAPLPAPQDEVEVRAGAPLEPSSDTTEL